MERPLEIKTTTYKVPTGHGNLYITVGVNDSGEPIEIIAVIGKTGGSIMAKAEVTGRLISLALHYGAPLEKVIEQIIDIRGEKPVPWKDTVIWSIPDAIGKTLEKNYLKGGNK